MQPMEAPLPGRPRRRQRTRLIRIEAERERRRPTRRRLTLLGFIGSPAFGLICFLAACFLISWSIDVLSRALSWL